MKVRKKYSVIVNENLGTLTLVRGNSPLAGFLEDRATCGITIWDCNFRQAIWHLNNGKSQGYSIGTSNR